jgi:hypothetical protein
MILKQPTDKDIPFRNHNRPTMINQARRKRGQNSTLLRSEVHTTGSKVRANPGPMMKSIFGRTPRAFGSNSGTEFGSPILGEERAIQVTSKIDLVNGPKRRKSLVQFRKVHPIQALESVPMTQLLRQNMTPSICEAKLQFIPRNRHQTERAEPILDQPMSSNSPSQTCHPGMQDG